MAILEDRTTCPRHPKTQTNLRCAVCGELICPGCLVQTPVGSKCRSCASQQSAKFFQPSGLQAALAILTALAAGLFAGWAVEFCIGFYTIFLSVVYGGFAGDMIIRASGRKRGIRMELIGGIGIALGAIVGRILVAALTISLPAQTAPPFGVWSVLIGLVMPSPIPAICLVIITASAVSKIRYL